MRACAPCQISHCALSSAQENRDTVLWTASETRATSIGEDKRKRTQYPRRGGALFASLCLLPSGCCIHDRCGDGDARHKPAKRQQGVPPRRLGRGGPSFCGRTRRPREEAANTPLVVGVVEILT